jgi:hypothetical protein
VQLHRLLAGDEKIVLLKAMEIEPLAKKR